jgi:D-sedoheptulose 7-phosphate isomerase
MSTDSNTFHARAVEYVRESAAITNALIDQCIDSVLSAAEMIAESFRNGKKLLICGNGGSAADCQHMAAEFVGVLRKDFKRSGLPAIALTTDTSFLTSYANDWGFEEVFERQVTTLGVPGDVLISISTSGTSKNVLRAIAAAEVRSMRTIGLSGSSGMSRSLDVAIKVPSADTQHIQEAHLVIEHLLCELVQARLFGDDPIRRAP